MKRFHARAWRRCAYLAVVLGMVLSVSYLAAPMPSRAQSATAEGGLYKLLTADGKHRHHMPAAESIKSVAGYNSDCGPAIRMEVGDHTKTASYGRGDKADGEGGVVNADQYRADQARLIQEGRFDEAMQMDIRNIKALFPGRTMSLQTKYSRENTMPL